MSQAALSLSDIIQRTQQDGGDWAVAHARRLVELIHDIGKEIAFNQDAVTLAAYLHDWVAFPQYAQPGVSHALRSRQVAETEILPRVDLPAPVIRIVLEAIELHDYRDARQTQSSEVLLLREADMLEFLGILGIAREFAWGHHDMAGSYQRILQRRAGIVGRFTLPHARRIAEVRLEHMDSCLSWLNEEGYKII
jgi:uncharacterized protein